MNIRTPHPSLTAVTALLAAGTFVLAGCSTETEPPPPSGTNGASAIPNSSQDAAPPEVLDDTAAVLTVEDQESEGPTVNVKAVAATEGGFVVVSADEGRNVLGSGIVPAGDEPQSIQVSLAEEPTEKIALLARLYADTNGDGFYGEGDRPLSNGKDNSANDPAFDGEQVAFDFTGKKVVNN